MNAKSEVRLNARQQRAAVLVAEGEPTASIVEQMGIHRQTLANWKSCPEFEAFVNQLLDEGRAAAHAKMISLSKKAGTVIEKLLDSDNEKIRLAAASYVMSDLPRIRIGPVRVGAIKSQRNLEKVMDFGETFAYREDREES